MGSDDYAAVGGRGALKIKGAKVHKKKKRDKTDLEKNLETGVVKREDKKRNKKDEDEEQGLVAQGDTDERSEAQKTESERRHEEIKKKRVGFESRR